MYTIQRPDGTYVRVGDLINDEDAECPIENSLIAHYDKEVVVEIFEGLGSLIDDVEGYEVVELITTAIPRGV